MTSPRTVWLLLALAACPAPSSPHGRVMGSAVAAPTYLPENVEVRLLRASAGTPEAAEDPLQLSELTDPVTLSAMTERDLDAGAVATLRTGASGDFRFDHLEPGRYHVLLVAQHVGSFYGTVRVLVPSVEVRAGRTNDLGRVELVGRLNPMDLHDGHEEY